MTTRDLIDAYVYGNESGKASDGRLRIEGKKLFNYATCLAERVDGGYIMNVTKYSSTTSRHQNRLKAELPVSDTIYVQDVPMGTQNLGRYVQ